MKQLFVPFLTQLSHRSSPQDLLAASTALVSHDLGEVPWPAFPYKPVVHFKIAHTIDSLLLVYFVKEKHVNALYRDTNDPVYKDSCVEFFLSFDGHHYYNLEFNCLGTGLVAYGDADKAKRRLLSKTTVEMVKTLSKVKIEETADVDSEWHLLLSIPFTVFDAHAIDSLAGMRCRGNFYKCGDELPLPHFVSWNAIDHPTPNFHLPQFFGELLFSDFKDGSENNIGN